jgi:hypothetical protein
VSLFLIGDVHGKTEEYLAALAAMPKNATSFALGDLYLGRPGISLPTMDPRHRFIRGNHDSPALAEAHPNFAGKFGFIPEDGGVFYLSGALTVSAPVLQNSKYWYADEELSPQELDAAIDLYRESKPRILLSHEGPSEIVAEMLAGLDGNYVEAKRQCAKSRTAQGCPSRVAQRLSDLDSQADAHSTSTVNVVQSRVLARLDFTCTISVLPGTSIRLWNVGFLEHRIFHISHRTKPVDW